MLAFLLLIICLCSQATACNSCTVPSITGLLNDLQLRAHITAVASTLNPPCTIEFVDASVLVNRVGLDLVLHYPRVLTAAEKTAHQIALKAAIVAKLNVLGLIETAITLNAFVGTTLPYRCSLHVLATPTVANIVASIQTPALDVRVALAADFLLMLPTAMVSCGEPIQVDAAVKLNINLSYLRALTAVEINAHALKIKAIIAAKIQPDVSKISVVLTKRSGLFGLVNIYDCVCTILGESDESAPKLLENVGGVLGNTGLVNGVVPTVTGIIGNTGLVNGVVPTVNGVVGGVVAPLLHDVLALVNDLVFRNALSAFCLTLPVPGTCTFTPALIDGDLKFFVNIAYPRVLTDAEIEVNLQLLQAFISIKLNIRLDLCNIIPQVISGIRHPLLVVIKDCPTVAAKRVVDAPNTIEAIIMTQGDLSAKRFLRS